MFPRQNISEMGTYSKCFPGGKRPYGGKNVSMTNNLAIKGRY
jgi:hypothetical protein